MECAEPKSHSWWWDSLISPENCKWLAENLEGVDQNVKQLMKLVEEDGNQKRPELVAHVEELCRMHHLLAERYDHLTGKLRTNVQLLTPDQKLGLQKYDQAIGFDLSPCSGGGSSEISLKEDFESSSSSSSLPDSDSESFISINKRLVPPTDGNDNGPHPKNVELETEFSVMEEKVQLTKHEDVYSTLERKELRVLNKKLQFSEKEIARLKVELNKKESVIVLMGNLQAQLEAAQCDIKMREIDLENERRNVSELEMQVTELETRICDSDSEIGTMEKELEITREKLRVSEEEIAKLKHEISSEILSYEADLSDRDHEIRGLNAALLDADEKFSLEKAQQQSDKSSLLENQALLNERIRVCELERRSLEYEIEQCKAENLEMKGFHKVDIEQLKAELEGKNELVETLNKTIDMLKLKYDMLMAEKDGINAKLDTLNAELRHRDNQIQQMEGHQHQLHLEHVELIGGCESARKLAYELRLRVEELEKEVDELRDVISDRSEEKREAIRQLCFSLEHYRVGYQQLRQAYIGHKGRAVLAL